MRNVRTTPNIDVSAVVHTRPCLSTSTAQLAPGIGGFESMSGRASARPIGGAVLRRPASAASYARRPPSVAETKSKLPSSARSRTLPFAIVNGPWRMSPAGLRVKK